MKIKILLLYLVFSISSANADDAGVSIMNITGNDFKRMAESKDPFQNGYAYGLVWSIFTHPYHLSGDVNSFAFCPPSKVSNKQALDIVVKHLNENPHLRHYDAFYSIVSSLKLSFPCVKE